MKDLTMHNYSVNTLLPKRELNCYITIQPLYIIILRTMCSTDTYVCFDILHGSVTRRLGFNPS